MWQAWDNPKRHQDVQMSEYWVIKDWHEKQPWKQHRTKENGNLLLPAALCVLGIEVVKVRETECALGSILSTRAHQKVYQTSEDITTEKYMKKFFDLPLSLFIYFTVVTPLDLQLLFDLPFIFLFFFCFLFHEQNMTHLLLCPFHDLMFAMCVLCSTLLDPNVSQCLSHDVPVPPNRHLFFL